MSARAAVLCAFLLGVAPLAPAALGARPPNTVVFELLSGKAERGQVDVLSARLRARVAATPGYRPFPRALVELRLATASFDENGQCGPSCQSRARDLLAAEWLLDGVVARSGDVCNVSLRLIDTINGGAKQFAVQGKCDAAGLGRSLDEAWAKARGGGEAAAPDAPPAFTPTAPEPNAPVKPAPEKRRLNHAVRAAVVARESTAAAHAAEAMLRQALQDQQLDVVDADAALVNAPGGAKKLSKTIDYLVRLRVETSSGPAFGGSALVPRLATLSWEVVSTGSGRVVRSGMASGRVAHIDALMGGVKAAGEAGKGAAVEIAQALNSGAP